MIKGMNIPIDELRFQDKVIVCVECGNAFVFNEGEQKYFLSKGLSIPKRCRRCRLARKMAIVRGDR